MSKQLKNRIEQLRVAAGPEANQRIRRAVDRAWNVYEQNKNEPAPAPVWRMIMNRKVTVLALAAVLVAAVIIGIFPSGPAQPLWAEIIKPVMQAQNAELTIIVGEPDSGTRIRDQVLGSRIRRTVEGFPNVTVIDLETSKILTLEPHTKVATIIEMQNLPQIPNYMEHLRNLLSNLEEAPHFEIEYLGLQTLDNGADALAMNVTYEGGRLFLAVDPQTYAPVQVDQHEGQLHILCRDIRFNVDLDPALFSMDIPEGYTSQQTQLDLSSGTEENFINGLRLWTQYIGDGFFPEDVRIESYMQSAPKIGQQLSVSGLSEAEQMEIGMALGRYLLFIRFYRGEGPWTYAGRGVQYGDPETPIFWYKPDKTEPYHVIYADLHVEKVENAQDLPPAPPAYDAVSAYDPARGYGNNVAEAEVAAWHLQPGDTARVHSDITLTLPGDAPSISIRLPYKEATLTTVLLNDKAVPFTANEEGVCEIPLAAPAQAPAKLLCVWSVQLQALELRDDGTRWISLKPLLPARRFELHVVLEENCGYQLDIECDDPTTYRPFSGSHDAPEKHFGECRLAVTPTP